MAATLCPSILIGPFEVYKDSGLLVCALCQVAIWPVTVKAHLRTNHAAYRGRDAAANKVNDEILTLVDQGWLAADRTALPAPLVLAGPIKCLPVHTDGWKCLFTGCFFLCGSLDVLRRHLRTEHGYARYGSNKGGRPTKITQWMRQDGYENDSGGANVEMFQRGILYHQPFRQNIGPRYVEIQYDSVEHDVELASPTWLTDARNILGKRKRETNSTILRGGATDRHPWAERVGIYQQLHGTEYKPLLELLDKPDPQADPVLHVIWTGFEEMYLVAHHNLSGYGIFTRGVAGQSYPEPQKGEKPLNPYQNPDPAGYTRPWKQLLMFFARSYDLASRRQHENTGPRYILNATQHASLSRLMHEAKHGDGLVLRQSDDAEDPDDTEWEGTDEGEEAIEPTPIHDVASSACGSALDRTTTKERDLLHHRRGLSTIARLCHEFCLSLIRQNNAGHEHNLPLVLAILLHALALHGIATPNAFNTKLCKLIKISRMINLEAVIEEHGIDCMVSLKSVVATYMVRGTASPMNWMMDTSTYLFAVDSHASSEPSMEWNGDELRYQDVTLRVGQFTSMIHSLLYEAKAHLEEEVLLGITPCPIPWDRFKESVQHRGQGLNFIDWSLTDPAERKWLEHAIMSNQALAERFDTARRRRLWLDAVDVLREYLLLLIYFTGGQPSRGSELLTLSHKNSNCTESRGIYYLHGHIATVITYAKGISKTGRSRVVYRFLPREVGELLVQYLWLILPFYELVETLESSNPRGEQKPSSHRIWSEASDCGEPWVPGRVSKLLRRTFTRFIGQPMGLRMTRQVLIALGRHLIKDPRCKFMEDDRDDTQIDGDVQDDVEAAFDHQAGHSTRTAQLHYARLTLEFSGSSENNRTRFFAMSKAWHQTIGFAVQGENQDYELDQAQVRKRLMMAVWTELQRHSTEPLAALQSLYPGAQFSDGQEQHIVSILKGRTPVCVIAPTGSGKTAAYLLPAYCAPSTMTIVVVPLVSLRSDLAKRCCIAGLKAVEWDPAQQAFDANIVFVTPECLSTHSFKHFMRVSFESGRLYRIAIDEVHTLLSCGDAFRPAFRSLKYLVRQGVRMLLLTATLPPHRECEIWQHLDIDGRTVGIHRQSTRRTNISYSVRNLDNEGLDDTEGRLIRIINGVLARKSRQKVVIYTTTRRQCERLALAIGCAAYHSKTIDKSALLDQFGRQNTSIICATSALSVGFHDPDISDVVHAGMPSSLSDFLQESGRAGRRVNSIARSLLLKTRMFDRRREDGQDIECIDQFVEAGWDNSHINCRRILIDRIMDGNDDEQSCQDGEQKCDLCSQTVPEALPSEYTTEPPYPDLARDTDHQQQFTESVSKFPLTPDTADRVTLPALSFDATQSRLYTNSLVATPCSLELSPHANMAYESLANELKAKPCTDTSSLVPSQASYIHATGQGGGRPVAMMSTNSLRRPTTAKSDDHQNGVSVQHSFLHPEQLPGDARTGRLQIACGPAGRTAPTLMQTNQTETPTAALDVPGCGGYATPTLASHDDREASWAWGTQAVVSSAAPDAPSIAHTSVTSVHPSIRLHRDYNQQEQALAAAKASNLKTTANISSSLETIRRARQKWTDRCVGCFLQGLTHDHKLDTCRNTITNSYQETARRVKSGLCYDKYSCCFICGLPQGTCPTWEEPTVTTEGEDCPSVRQNHKRAYKKAGPRRCDPYFGINFIFATCAGHEDINTRWRQRMSAQSIDCDDVDGLRRYLQHSKARDFDRLNGVGREFEWIVGALSEVTRHSMA